MGYTSETRSGVFCCWVLSSWASVRARSLARARHRAGCSVDGDTLAGDEPVGGVAGADHGGEAVFAGHDRGVGGEGAAVGDNGGRVANNGVQAGAVERATNTSPGRKLAKSAGSVMTRTGPVARPALAGWPMIASAGMGRSPRAALTARRIGSPISRGGVPTVSGAGCRRCRCHDASRVSAAELSDVVACSSPLVRKNTWSGRSRDPSATRRSPSLSTQVRSSGQPRVKSRACASRIVVYRRMTSSNPVNLAPTAGRGGQRGKAGGLGGLSLVDEFLAPVRCLAGDRCAAVGVNGPVPVGAEDGVRGRPKVDAGQTTQQDLHSVSQHTACPVSWGR